MLDLVLRGGRVCDGSGGSAHDADVGIEAGGGGGLGRPGWAAPPPPDRGGPAGPARLCRRALRAYVMGDGAYTRAARAGEVETMAALVREGMAAGALGFATSRSPAHVGEGGRPVPSRQARRAEVDALVGAMAASGRGVLEITP